MNLAEIIIIAIGLSMDAFAVSICKGLSVEKLKPRHCLSCGLYFGGFQALMPLIGYFLGVRFERLIENVDHWVAFALLSIIGINMIRSSRAETEQMSASFTPRDMLPLAVATSIDALAVGISFALLKVRIVPAVCLIGTITFALSALGAKIGSVFGAKYKKGAELAGGIILILIGIKILFEHLGVITQQVL